MTAEFQAVILAGGSGIRLYPLTENHPKCLLIVNNKPLLWYQLDLLERSGFTEVLVVTTEDFLPKISHFTTHQYNGKMLIELCTVTSNLETGEALRAIQDKIKTKDFFVLAGDLITNVVIHHLADIHRISNATVTMFLKEEANGDLNDKKKVFKSKAGVQDEDLIDCIGLTLEEKEKRIVFLAPAVYLEEKLNIPKCLMKRYLNISFHTNLSDAHFYIFSRSIFKVLNEKPKKLSSLKADLIPYLVNNQFHDGSSNTSPEMSSSPQALAEAMSCSHHEGKKYKDLFKCFAYVIPSTGAYCSRANTTIAFEAMKKDMQKLNSFQ